MRFAVAILVWLGLAFTAPALAQPVASPVLVIEGDRLFVETAYGRSLAAEIEAQAAEWQQENERIVAELVSEERSLAEQRPDMDPDAFRAAAEAFDTKVQEVRRERDAKTVELQQLGAEARALFEENVRGIIAAIMIERGGQVVLDQRSVVLSIRAVNITDTVIARIDAELGDGGQ